MANEESIVIKSRAGMQQVINTLNGLHAQIAPTLTAADAVTTAVTAAASKGVTEEGVVPAEGSTAQQVAPAYVGSLTAIGAVSKNVRGHVDAAGTSMRTAIDDLQALLDGLGGIDDASAAEVRKA